MIEFTFNRPCDHMPAWAGLERQYLALASRAPEMLADYLTPDGEILWPTCVKDFQTFAYGNVDNAFEGFSSFPLLYLLGGDDQILRYSQREYDVLTRQFSMKKKIRGVLSGASQQAGRDTMLVDEWFPDLDWMHCGEASMFLYYLTLANPGHRINTERVKKFAQYTFGENPAGFERNYDPEHRVFKSGYFGANGPAWERFGGPIFHSSWMDFYGLAFYDVPGVTTYYDLEDPEKAARYGKVYGERLSHCDTVTNLMATSMATLAYMAGAGGAYKTYALDYIQGWRDRSAEYEVMPDNAGPDGKVGSTLGGRFYGSHYGWTHPHGYYFIADALIIAGENERLLTGRRGTLQWARDLYEYLSRYGYTDEHGRFLFPQKHADEGSVIEYIGNKNTPMTRPDRVTNYPGLVRYKQVDGWYEFGTGCPAHLGHIYADDRDARLTEKFLSSTAMEHVTPSAVMKKFKGGQHAAYVGFLEGRYPDYPEDVLRHSIDLIYKQVDILNGERAGIPAALGYAPDGSEQWEQLRAITGELRERYGLRFDESVVHSYYQTFLLYRTPLSMEAMLNLTMGAMTPIYNGGLLHSELRWFNADRKRPGLPEDVAALIEKIDGDRVTVTVCNLDPVRTHTAVIQGGAYGEHRIEAIFDGDRREKIEDKWCQLSFAPGTRATFTLELKHYAYQPSLEQPFGDVDYLND